MWNIAFSGFHYNFVTLGRGAIDMAAGHPFKGEAVYLRALTGALTKEGREMRAALRTPGPMDARVAENLSLMVEGGRRIQGDPRPFWQAAWRAGFELHGSKLNPFTYAKWAARLTSKHLMEHYVPQVKDGAYLELGRQRLEAAMKAAGPKGLTDMERAAVLQEAGKHVDNILGQMIADNLHYSRGLKNTLSAAIGYPGWTLGSVRAMVNAATGAAKLPIAAVGGPAKLNAQEEISLKFALAMTVVVGTYGSLLCKVLTGHWPRTLQEAFQIPTGDKDIYGNEKRVQLPSYMKDYLGWAFHPIKTAQGKLNPLFEWITEIWENKDFYNREIHDPHAPLSTQLGQYATWAGLKYVPYGIRNVQAQHQAGVRTLPTLLSEVRHQSCATRVRGH